MSNSILRRVFLSVSKYLSVLVVNGIAIFFIFLSCNSSAQIVNIENQRLNAKTEGWKIESDLNFSIIKNTLVVLQFGNRNRINYNKEEHHYLFLTDFGVVKADGSDFVNNGFSHFRYSYNLRKFPKCYLETFAQAQYNRVQLVDFRGLLGAGGRIEAIKLDSIALNVGAFIMGEHEEQSDNITNQNFRYSCFLSFDYQFSKSTGFNTITYYQPQFLDPSDYRLSMESSLRFVVTKKISFRIVYNLFYDTNPPMGIPTTTYYLQNAISLRF